MSSGNVVRQVAVTGLNVSPICANVRHVRIQQRDLTRIAFEFAPLCPPVLVRFLEIQVLKVRLESFTDQECHPLTRSIDRSHLSIKVAYTLVVFKFKMIEFRAPRLLHRTKMNIVFNQDIVDAGQRTPQPRDIPGRNAERPWPFVFHQLPASVIDININALAGALGSRLARRGATRPAAFAARRLADRACLEIGVGGTVNKLVPR